MQQVLITLSLVAMLSGAPAFACDSDDAADATDPLVSSSVVAVASDAAAIGHRLEAWNRMEAAQTTSADDTKVISIPYINDTNRGCE